MDSAGNFAHTVMASCSYSEFLPLHPDPAAKNLLRMGGFNRSLNTYKAVAWVLLGMRWYQHDRRRWSDPKFIVGFSCRRAVHLAIAADRWSILRMLLVSESTAHDPLIVDDFDATVNVKLPDEDFMQDFAHTTRREAIAKVR